MEREHCEICGATDPLDRHLWHHRWMQVVEAVVIGGVGIERLWRDRGKLRTCGRCAVNPPDGWRRYS